MLRRGFEHAVALTLDHRVGGIPADGMIIAAGAHEAVDLRAFDFCCLSSDSSGMEARKGADQAEGAEGQGVTGEAHEKSSEFLAQRIDLFSAVEGVFKGYAA